MRLSAFFAISGLFLFSRQISADEAAEGFKINTGGYFIWDAGMLREAEDLNGITYETVAFGDLMAGLVLTANPTDRLSLRINPELKSYYPFPQEVGGANFEGQYRPRWNVYVEEAWADWKFGNPDRPTLQAGLGYMIHKENGDARIFGDYLFRSMVYPGVLFTKFNYPQAQIFGLRLKHRMGSGFAHDVVVSSETKRFPYFDFSLAYTAAYSYKNLFEVGAGVNLKSVLPMRPSQTTPKFPGFYDTRYKEIPIQPAVTIPGDLMNPTRTITIQAVGPDSTDVIVTDSVGAILASARVAGQGVEGLRNGLFTEDMAALDLLVDPVTRHLYPQLAGTETPYSFAGTIVMGRVAVNPLGFMEKNPLGPNALKVYAEGAVLGWKNYPGYYAKRRERIPLMAGVNLPTFGFLDMLALEFEYYPNPYYPGNFVQSFYGLPLPLPHKDNAKWIDSAQIGKKDDWKWALAAKKSYKGFALVAQVGIDHTKLPDKDGMEYNDILIRPSHWYAQFRFIGGFY